MRFDYPLNNVNTYETVGEFLQKAEARFGDRPAVTVYDGGERSTVTLTGRL